MLLSMAITDLAHFPLGGNMFHKMRDIGKKNTCNNQKKHITGRNLVAAYYE